MANRFASSTDPLDELRKYTHLYVAAGIKKEFDETKLPALQSALSSPKGTVVLVSGWLENEGKFRQLYLGTDKDGLESKIEGYLLQERFSDCQNIRKPSKIMDKKDKDNYFEHLKHKAYDIVLGADKYTGNLKDLSRSPTFEVAQRNPGYLTLENKTTVMPILACCDSVVAQLLQENYPDAQPCVLVENLN